MPESVKYDTLKLDNQLCFPLYACSKEIVRRYTPLLDKLGLTYTQYITMMVLWEENELAVSELGNKLFLDSGTLTPLLKKLEAKGFIQRKRCATDERKVVVSLTDAGLALRDDALQIPEEISTCVDLPAKDALQLYNILHKLMDSFRD